MSEDERCADVIVEPRWSRWKRSTRRRLRHELMCLWGCSGGYRRWARLLHGLNLHHTRSNVMDDGSVLTRCDWCGLRQSRYPESEQAR